MKTLTCFVLSLSIMSAAAAAGEMDIFETMRNRRSIRAYKSDPVPRDDIEKVLDAACMAPTSGNQQPWKFLVIEDGERIGQLKDACISAALERYKDDEEYKSEEAQTKLKQRAEGYYSKVFSAPLYIVVLTDSISEEITMKVLSIPDRYTRVCITPLGVPVEWPETPEKKALCEFIAYESIG